MTGPTIRKGGTPSFRKSAIAALLLSASVLAGCASKPPEISYDADVPPLPSVPAAITDNRPKPLHVPKFREVMVRPKGFEPPTSGLGIRCSILLSYGRIFLSG